MRKKAPNGERFLRVLLILERLGGPAIEFRWADLARTYGEKWAADSLRKWVPAGRIVKIARGRYRLEAKTIAEARNWLDGDGPFLGLGGVLADGRSSEEMRTAIAEEEAERFRRDEEALDAAAEMARIGSPMFAVRELLDRERRLRRSQAGRCVLALKAAGRALSRKELGDALGSRVADISVWQAVKDGVLVRLKHGLYDLPSRSKRPMAKDLNELVLLVIASIGPSSVREITEAAGEPREAVKRNALFRLRKRGHVERLGPERYGLTQEGWEAVRQILERNIGRGA